MKKAFDALTAQGLEYQFHDYKKQGIDEDTLQTWLNEIGQDTILNKKGTTWRKLTEQEQEHALSSQAALIDTLMHHTSLIKRPILQSPTGYIVGFDVDAYQALK